MNKPLLLIIMLLVSLTSFAQKKTTVYLSPKDTIANKYIVVYPKEKPYKGFMVLIPGMFQQAADVLKQTPLATKAAESGIVTVIPTFSTGISSMGIDAETQQSLVTILNDVVRSNTLEAAPFYLGGFSIGGTCALKYAEVSISKNFALQPKAVFAVDAPLDFERMYHSIERELRLPNGSEGAREEGEYIKKRFDKAFGGPPKNNLAKYYEASPYSFSDTTQTAIKPLANLPLRLYTEPDIMWWLNDTSDYSGMNAFDFAALTNELKRMGSTKVELIVTENRGYRQPDKVRHPHSWSIVDSDNLISWLLKQK